MSKPIEYGRPWWEVMKEVSEENDSLYNYILYRLEVRNAELEAENGRLKAEVERLRKAGDELAGMVGYDVAYEDQKELEKAWNAAKEGKPSV